MENQKTSTTKRNKLFLFTYIFSTLLFLFFSLAILPKLIGELMGAGKETLIAGDWEGKVMAATYFVFVIGFAISWFKKYIASIIILLAAVLQMAPFIIIDQNFGSLIFGLPLLLIGILLFVLHKQQNK